MTHHVLLLFLMPSFAFARLGEKEQELEARFGSATLRAKEATFVQGRRVEFGTRLGFQQDDWTIECVIIDDRSAKEVYGKRGDWTADQIRTVLTVNAQGAKWTEISKQAAIGVLREWRREDGAIAIWQKGSGMTVTHPAFPRAQEIAEAKAKSNASKVPKL